MLTSWLVLVASLLSAIVLADPKYQLHQKPQIDETGWWNDGKVIRVYYGKDLKAHAKHLRDSGFDNIAFTVAASQEEHDENRKEAMKLIGDSSTGEARDEKPPAMLSYRPQYQASLRYVPKSESDIEGFLWSSVKGSKDALDNKYGTGQQIIMVVNTALDNESTTGHTRSGGRFRKGSQSPQRPSTPARRPPTPPRRSSSPGPHLSKRQSNKLAMYLLLRRAAQESLS